MTCGSWLNWKTGKGPVMDAANSHIQTVSMHKKDAREKAKWRNFAVLDGRVVRIASKKTGLLTADGEVVLAKRIMAGQKAALALDVASGAAGDDLGEDERKRLEAEVALGAEAREQFAEANQGLVRKYAQAYSGGGIPLEDLVQEGCDGLLKAIEQFDYTMGFRFSTYATHKIRRAMQRAVENKGRPIRLPVHVGEGMRKVARTREGLSSELGREPTLEEVCEATGFSADKVRELDGLKKQTVTSLDAPVGDDGDTPLGDFLEDDHTPNPCEVAEGASVRDVVKGALGVLSSREQKVIEMRFGLRDGIPKTLEEVGRCIGVTHERIRQIEGKALAKLRVSETMQALRAELV